MIAPSASTTTTRRRRRSSSITLTAVAAMGLAMCAGVADGFAVHAGPMRASSRASPISTSMTTTASTPLVAPLAAVGVEPDARSNGDKPTLKFGNCEDSWDCEGTQSCCDYVLFRMCCNDGKAVREQWVPVPIPVRPNDGYPGPYNPPRQGGYR